MVQAQDFVAGPERVEQAAEVVAEQVGLAVRGEQAAFGEEDYGVARGAAPGAQASR